ncbi:hypothetical protein RFI_18192 [Reticulomyxa filosa]|uniref:Uncharacterized protein n=1 Tax=Reticulomyxa filosa TaxID=46433 RepID=X6MZ09_RETFI|nr:hypothetical protein RFI_18192 [Reticulomyxa filosa]|eukprot:ETO19046.1 hypothetical protein RFI_18192 [Reticulomyxa filosa]
MQLYDGNANQWQNYSTEEYTGAYDNNNITNIQQQDIIGRLDQETDGGKEDDASVFETLTLSDWYIVIESRHPERVETYQNQLFQMSPTRLKTFRLELPSSPIQTPWVDQVKWTQLSEFLSQAPLESVVVTSHLQTKLDEYSDQDYQELQPVAKFVSSLKCKCLTLEHAPCKITPEYIQSLFDGIGTLKLLCPSIKWDVELVQALSPKSLGKQSPKALSVQ